MLTARGGALQGSLSFHCGQRPVTHCRQVWRLPTPLWGVPSLDVRGLLRPPIRTSDR
jgi:hypothetical protein